MDEVHADLPRVKALLEAALGKPGAAAAAGPASPPPPAAAPVPRATAQPAPAASSGTPWSGSGVVSGL
jgi:hypothetical protein